MWQRFRDAVDQLVPGARMSTVGPARRRLPAPARAAPPACPRTAAATCSGDRRAHLAARAPARATTRPRCATSWTAGRARGDRGRPPRRRPRVGRSGSGRWPRRVQPAEPGWSFAAVLLLTAARSSGHRWVVGVVLLWHLVAVAGAGEELGTLVVHLGPGPRVFAGRCCFARRAVASRAPPQGPSSRAPAGAAPPPAPCAAAAPGPGVVPPKDPRGAARAARRGVTPLRGQRTVWGWEGGLLSCAAGRAVRVAVLHFRIARRRAAESPVPMVAAARVAVGAARVSACCCSVWRLPVPVVGALVGLVLAWVSRGGACVTRSSRGCWR
jgi:hypothetical protein